MYMYIYIYIYSPYQGSVSTCIIQHRNYQYLLDHFWSRNFLKEELFWYY